MNLKKAFYKGAGAILTVATLTTLPGCAVKENPAPIETPVQPIDTENKTPIVEVTITPTPKPTPTVTPEPTPNLMFKTIEDINNEDIVKNQALLFIQEMKNSDVEYTSYFKHLSEENLEDLVNCLKWFSGRPSNTEPSLENIQFIKDAIINRIRNDEMWTIINILKGEKDPIINAKFIGYKYFIPSNTEAYNFNNRLEEIKVELASKPSRERQLELTQEIKNLVLSFMLSYEKGSKKNYYGEIETEGYEIYIFANLYLLFNVGGEIDINLDAQYPIGHEKYPEYTGAKKLIKEFFDFSGFIWGEAENRIIIEIKDNQEALMTRMP